MAEEQSRQREDTSPAGHETVAPTEASARHIRHRLLGKDLRRYQDEHGPFTQAELSEARKKISG